MNANERAMGAEILGEIEAYTPPRVVAYQTIEEAYMRDLDAEVTARLADGWVLYGDPRFYPENDHSEERYQQTMVKFSEEDPA